MGRNRKKHPELPWIPLCRACHDLDGTEAMTLALIAKAPDWWKAQGEWANAEPYFERFVSKRRYQREVQWVR